MRSETREISRGNKKREVVVITHDKGRCKSVTHHERFIGGEWRRKRSLAESSDLGSLIEADPEEAKR